MPNDATNSWTIRPEQCELLLVHDSGRMARIGLASRAASAIAAKGFLRFDRLPDTWYEVHGMSRIEGGLTDLQGVRAFVAKVMPSLFILSDGSPLIWQCSRRHARFYERVFREGCYTLSFVAGSLAGGPSISDWSSLTGGSDDEQIVMLSLTH